MSKLSQQIRRNLSLWTLILAMLSFPLQPLAADAICQAFMVQGDELVLDSALGNISSGSLAKFVSALETGESLSVDFSASQICVTPNALVSPEPSSVMFAVNPAAEEVAVKAQIAGSTELWLRLSPAYQSELLLDRPVGEEIGLTDMEFLSDNSGVGAEDFFAEPIDYLELGELTLDAPFAEVPRFGVKYEHYNQNIDRSAESFTATQGTLGYSSLRRLTLTFSPSQGLVNISE